MAQALVETAERVTLLISKAPAWAGYDDPDDPAHEDKEAILRNSIWFFGIICVSAWCICYYGMHAIFSVNAFELLAFFLTSLALIIRLSVEFVNTEEECSGSSKNMCLIFFTVSLGLCIANLILTCWMYTDLTWKRYKAIGADVNTRSVYRNYELFIAVKKLDLQFAFITLFTGIVFFSSLETQTVQIAMGINVVMFIIELVWERLGDYAITQENVMALCGFWALSIFLPAFLINIAIDYIRHGNLLRDANTTSIQATIFVFAGICIANRIVTVICSYLLYRSFGERFKGVRRILSSDGQIFDRSRVKMRLKPVRKLPSSDAAPRALYPVNVELRKVGTTTVTVKGDGGNRSRSSSAAPARNPLDERRGSEAQAYAGQDRGESRAAAGAQAVSLFPDDAGAEALPVPSGGESESVVSIANPMDSTGAPRGPSVGAQTHAVGAAKAY